LPERLSSNARKLILLYRPNAKQSAITSAQETQLTQKQGKLPKLHVNIAFLKISNAK